MDNNQYPGPHVATGQELADLERREIAKTAPPVQQVHGFAIPIVLYLIGFYLLYGLATMQVPESATAPGPKMFPGVVTVLLFTVATIMGSKAILERRRDRHHPADSAGLSKLDWPAVAIVGATFLVFAVLLVPLGWIISGALLFWGVALGLGSRSWLKDALLSLGVSSIVQICFSAGLGLNLPAGILGLI